MAYNFNRPTTSGVYGSSSSSSNQQGPVGALTTLAEWAARNLDAEAPATKLQRLVDRACDPYLGEPNLALNLEVADYVNRKKANTPREAAIETVRRINSRSPHISMLALSLLDMLVKNCGYAFHLQIATKEFLNELVKRFPERPPLFLSPYQSKVLELIHEWKLTICITSKHKEDLVHIRDMHRLLSYKGYRFPNVDTRASSVLNPENNLKTPDELEEEEREAQAAKLQELIRRGRPQDLHQAQELMKIMSGAEPESKPDYKAQTTKELDKVQSKAVLLNDMLNQAKEGERFVKDDAYDQICTQLKSVQPRLQKWISEVEEEDENSSMDRLLLINDTINQVIARYASYVKGDFSATVSIDPSIDPSKGGADAVPTPKVTDLISFDFDDGGNASASGTKSAETGSNSLMDDFASLRFDIDAAGSASLQPSQQQQRNGAGSSAAPLLDLSKVSSQPTAAGMGGVLGGISLPMNGGAAVAQQTPMTASLFGSSSSTFALQQQQQPLQPSKPAASGATAHVPPSANTRATAAAKAADPFAGLDDIFK
ncbi:VHS-domain-containing protein [Tilletiaria anomala UBC 951]|uniref:VHS-domain-containing protein n=1 Tax=Tilletiaria anomala (strain ATCC 24038 / CBS 436.72 / UBC 951) TaxID=1037660 RepID=A0A066VES8_TILAU|nr:VHS-domain-containing protein [Tilletiaria anomala UBC 951]KDN39951.1 VHS-domain-containing protein [Tilletiaria anomala UBC 951]